MDKRITEQSDIAAIRQELKTVRQQLDRLMSKFLQWKIEWLAVYGGEDLLGVLPYLCTKD